MAARELSSAVARFAALLRRHGLPVTLVHATDAVRALDHLDIGDRGELYLGLKTIFVARPEETGAFDRCFEAFWRRTPDGEGIPGLLQIPSGETGESDATLKSSGQKRESLALDTWGTDEDEAEDAGEPLSVPAASDTEALVGRDFATFGADQLDEILRLTLKIARRLARRITRRRRPVRRRGRVDLRRTLRANLTKGDLIDLRFRERKRKKVRLLLLCDVSGSMDLYSRFLLQFLFALQSVFGRGETFTFSTRLTRITDHLRARSYRQVLRRLSEVRDSSGGTRIGESLAQWNREWPQLVHSRGATPRKEGAKMLVGEGGAVLGSVTIGGCVDAQVIEQSEDVLETMRPRLIEMNLGDEEAWEIGLTCGGTIEVFVEPVAFDRPDDAALALYERVRRHAAAGRAGAIVTRRSAERRVGKAGR